MKLLNSLILLVLTCLVSSINTQFISIQKYDFSGNCKNSSDSASSFEASSESAAICMQNDLLSGIVTNEGVCLIFNEIPTTFLISSNGDYVVILLEIEQLKLVNVLLSVLMITTEVHIYFQLKHLSITHLIPTLKYLTMANVMDNGKLVLTIFNITLSINVMLHMKLKLIPFL
ncbi:counting factor associated protein [Dictyostelium discoideum AX4]|uniref:Counting factor-associated protein B n=1 Tax=Dictyostelium discoideum TaxID=44689 RepID=CFAB_DICDI|nr:counting factor associated protein [Dictyostelium discoideum AX4]Q1ZXJ7.1 RecName: Full=Counting factor-associated protein B; Flags: Precursor [Dictyostelium discoideum]EAS66902.1 counting factor associated protein [Dictyostelium discoideum AX4]|eukprot:XP_001134586.1 counting factor associated protein [Dictyostelium discoideum AX4]